MIYTGAAQQSIIENSAVYNMDCMEALRQTPDKYYSLAIVDPPYGLGDRLSDGGGKLKNTPMAALYRESSKWDVKPNKAYFDELFRVSKNQIICGANYFIDCLGNSRGVICWDKKQTMPTLSSWELLWSSFDKPAKTFYGTSTDLNRFHPTQKPIALYKWLLQNYAVCKKCHNEGSIWEDVVGDGGSRMQVDCEYCDVAIDGIPKILDTHLGSGSSRIAAYDMGFDFTGFELDADYFAAQEKRFAEHVIKNGNRLFQNEPKEVVTQTKLL